MPEGQGAAQGAEQKGQAIEQGEEKGIQGKDKPVTACPGEYFFQPRWDCVNSVISQGKAKRQEQEGQQCPPRRKKRQALMLHKPVDTAQEGAYTAYFPEKYNAIKHRSLLL